MFLIDFLFQMGGAERSLYLLAKGLKKRGHKISICSLKSGELSQKMLLEGFQVYDLNLVRIYDPRALRAVVKMSKVIREQRISVLVSIHESSDFLGLFLSKLTKTPILSSRRDMGFRLKRRHLWLYRFLNPLFDHIITVSAAVKELISRTQFVKSGSITVVRNGVEPNFGRNRQLNFQGMSNPIKVEDGCLKVCYVANLRSIKGHTYLIDAANLVVKRFPSVRFLFVGKKVQDDPYCIEVERKVRALGLEDIIEFTGDLSHEKVMTFLAATDICVSSSLSEGMSNALLEAMSLGKPIVATTVGGNPEIVDDGKTGFLVPPGDPQSMAEALFKLLTNAKLRNEMAVNGTYRAEKEFRADKMVNMYEDLLLYACLKSRIARRKRLWLLFRRAILRLRFIMKLILASIIYFSGIHSIFLLFKKTLRLGKVKILCFHDVSEMSPKLPQFGISITSSAFHNLLYYLSTYYRIVSLEEAIQLLKSEQPLREDVFALTFDDCYKGWINHVLPECQRFNAPCTFFVATGPLDSGQPLLYDALIFLAERTWRKVVDLSSIGQGVFLLDRPEGVLRFVDETHRYWTTRSRKERDNFLQELSDYLEVSLDTEDMKDRVLEWDDLRKIDRAGFTVGAHTVSHGYLTAQPEDERIWEIYTSKQRIEKELGHRISFFAHPYGIIEEHDNRTLKIIEDARFSYAFTLQPTYKDGAKLFEIERRCMSPGMFVNWNGLMNKALISAELSGVGDFLFYKVFQAKRRLQGSMLPVNTLCSSGIQAPTAKAKRLPDEQVNQEI